MGKRIWAIAFSVCLAAFTAYAALDTFAFADVYQEGATAVNTSMFSDVEQAETSQAEASQAETSQADTSQAEASQTGASAVSGQSRESAPPGHGMAPGGKPSHSGLPNGGAGVSSDGASTAQAASTASTAQAASTASTSSGQAMEYSDANVSICVTEYDVSGTAVYVADVTASSAECLKTAFANDSYGRNITAATSQIAADHNAVLAINGDNYGSREQGYVIRNGVVYRDTSDGSDVLCIYADGTFKIVDPSTVSAQELVEQGVWQAFSFGPALVQGGSVTVSQNDEVGRAMASNPRTAIGVISANHFVLVVSDGRTSESEGLSLYELAQFMQQELGVECAYNLDGGGSSTMVFQGTVVNNPTTNGNTIKERSVNDIVYIG